MGRERDYSVKDLAVGALAFFAGGVITIKMFRLAGVQIDSQVAKGMVGGMVGLYILTSIPKTLKGRFTRA